MGDVIFDAFADPTWRDINEEWNRGEIPTSERARRQFALVQATEREFLELIERHAIDPAFPPLVAALRTQNIPVQVVSDGFDAYVKPMLGQAGLSNLPFQSNGLSFSNGAIQLEFPTNVQATTRAAAGRPDRCGRSSPRAGAWPTRATA